MKKGNPIRYLTACGCEVERSGIKRIRFEGNTNLSACAIHRRKVLSRVRACCECGEDFELHLHGPGVERCPDCAKKEKLRKRQLLYKKNKKAQIALEVVKWSTDPRGDFCSWMKSCISNRVLRCDGCRKFDGVFFGYDPGKKCA